MPSDELEIGQRIRQRRQDLGLSLRELARRTDLTASFISQVERGMTNTSIGSLRRISEALGVSILQFLTESPKPNPVIRANQRPRLSIPGSKLTYEMLVPDMTHKMEAIQARLLPNSGNVARPLRDPTEEIIYVLQGKLKVGLAAGEYELEAGDSIYFEGLNLRELSCASDEATVWISVITPPVF